MLANAITDPSRATGGCFRFSLLELARRYFPPGNRIWRLNKLCNREIRFCFDHSHFPYPCACEPKEGKKFLVNKEGRAQASKRLEHQPLPRRRLAFAVHALQLPASFLPTATSSLHYHLFSLYYSVGIHSELREYPTNFSRSACVMQAKEENI